MTGTEVKLGSIQYFSTRRTPMKVQHFDSGRILMEFDPDESIAAYNALVFLAHNAEEKEFAAQLMDIANQLRKEISMFENQSRLQ